MMIDIYCNSFSMMLHVKFVLNTGSINMVKLKSGIIFNLNWFRFQTYSAHFDVEQSWYPMIGLSSEGEKVQLVDSEAWILTENDKVYTLYYLLLMENPGDT